MTTPASRTRRILAIATALGTAATTAMTSAVTVPAFAQTGGQVTFSVTNFTDFHGHLESTMAFPAEEGQEMGAAALAALVKKVNEGQEYKLTTSGDNVGGSAFISAAGNDEATLEALNAMGVDVSAVGNHEFDKGFTDITGRIQPGSNYPILGANVLKDGKPAMKASEVQEINGVKVGFVGSVTTLLKDKVSPAALEGLEITDPVEATNAEATRLKGSGEADVVVALFHEDASQYAEKFNADVDILFGGDSHVKTSGEVQRQDALPLYWAQGWEYGKLLNDADITFDTGADKLVGVKITQYDATATAGLNPDATVADIVAKAKAASEEKGAEVVGSLDAPLKRGSDAGKDSGSNRGVESTANNYIAEATRHSMSAAVGKEIDLGIMNAGGVRADLPQGEVTYKDVLTAQPFGNNIAYGTLTGADILAALEAQWQPGASRPRLSLGLSKGVSYAFDPEAEQGKRIIQATINGEPIDPAKEYTVAASTFLFDGGDNFESLANVKNKVDVGLLDATALADYINSEDSAVPAAQTAVGVSAPREVTPGETITVDLSSLNYTTEGEPMATTATVKLGSAEAKAEIDNAAQEGDDQLNLRGRATVELTVPAGLTGAQEFVITTDKGTKVTVPVTVKGGQGAPSDASSHGSSGSSNGSSAGDDLSSGIVGAGAAIAALLALVAGVAGAAVHNPALVAQLPAPLREIIAKLGAMVH